MNRFYDIPGDVSTQLAPWELEKRNQPLNKSLFLLQKEVRFRSDIAFGGDIVVPPGFLSDLASIPQFAWSIFMAPDDCRIELGGWVHDYLYSKQGQVFPEKITTGRYLTRKECDQILAFECMPELCASRFKQYAVYYALRLFGSFAWNKK